MIMWMNHVAPQDSFEGRDSGTNGPFLHAKTDHYIRVSAQQKVLARFKTKQTY